MQVSSWSLFTLNFSLSVTNQIQYNTDEAELPKMVAYFSALIRVFNFYAIDVHLFQYTMV